MEMFNHHETGIYVITNKVNGKVYIGKTLNFHKRKINYLSGIKHQRTKKINQYFLNAFLKYGTENFSFDVLEVCKVDALAERELYWMKYYKSTDKDKGYNLRMDSSTGMICHQRTRDKISKRVRKEYENGTRCTEEISKRVSAQWEDKVRLNRMRENVSRSRRSVFIQKKRNGEVVEVWFNIQQLLQYNPEYKWQNIYAACNGNKKSYMNFLWERYHHSELPDVYSQMVCEKPFKVEKRS